MVSYIFSCIGATGCAAGFIEDTNSERCFWFSEGSDTYDNSVSDCKSKTQNEGYLAEIRTTPIYNFVISHKQRMRFEIYRLFKA